MISRLPSAIFLLLLAVGCADGKQGQTEKSTTPTDTTAAVSSKIQLKVVPVHTEALRATDIIRTVLAHGVTGADKEVTYAAEIAGKLSYLGPELGDQVKKGQVIARIDFKTLKAQADQARIQYNLAKSTCDRLGKLKEKEMATQQSYDEACSGMMSAEAQMIIAQDMVAKGIIKASHGGIVAEKFSEKSEYVAPGVPLLRVLDYSNVIVSAQLPETEVAAIGPGSVVKVEIRALGGTWNGTVDTILPTANWESRTFTVRIRIPNPDLKILVGMSATITVDSGILKEVIAAPQSAVLESQSGVRSVFIAAGGKAVSRVVHVGMPSGDRVVLLDGVAAGEKIIVVGHRDLIDGQPIKELSE